MRIFMILTGVVAVWFLGLYVDHRWIVKPPVTYSEAGPEITEEPASTVHPMFRKDHIPTVDNQFYKCSSETSDYGWLKCMQDEAAAYVNGCPDDDWPCRISRARNFDITWEIRETIEDNMAEDRKNRRNPFRELSHESSDLDWGSADRLCMWLYRDEAGCKRMAEREIERRKKEVYAFAAGYKFRECKDDICQCYLEQAYNCISDCWSAYWDVHDECGSSCMDRMHKFLKSRGEQGKFNKKCREET